MKLLRAAPAYNEKIKQYGKKDGLCAFLLFGVIVLLYAVLGLLAVHSSFVKSHITAAGCLVNLLLIAIAILFVKGNGQSLATIGLSGGNWKASCIAGILLGAVFVFNNCVSHLLSGGQLLPLGEIGVLLVYFLLVALCEEIVFRGYIGTRIYGLIQKKWLAIAVTGILFVAMHYPYRMIAGGMTFSQLTFDNFGWILNLFFTHVLLNFIYLKTDSLYGAILPHWLSNLAYNIVQ